MTLYEGTSRIHKLFSIDHLLRDDDRDIRDPVRSFVDKEIAPHVADWCECAQIPARYLALELGKLGVLGLHLEGYGCAGSRCRRTSSPRPSWSTCRWSWAWGRWRGTRAWTQIRARSRR